MQIWNLYWESDGVHAVLLTRLFVGFKLTRWSCLNATVPLTLCHTNEGSILKRQEYLSEMETLLHGYGILILYYI
jgi:hypothetical protein